MQFCLHIGHNVPLLPSWLKAVAKKKRVMDTVLAYLHTVRQAVACILKVIVTKEENYPGVEGQGWDNAAWKSRGA